MDIVIHSLGMPFNGETVEKRSLGGSESAAYYQARELARRGHRVSVFTASQEEGLFEGVQYCFAGNPAEGAPLGDRFEFYARNTPHDVLIIQRHPGAFHNGYASKINLWQLHDLALHRTAGMVNHGMWQIDAVTCVSEWHKKQVCEVYGFDPEFVQVVPNGVDETLYASTAPVVPPSVPQGKFLLLYQSRPERGLEHLVRPGGIMDRLRDTGAHLLVCAYDNTVGPMAQYYGMLHRWAAALPNVTILGALTKAQLAALQKSCDLLVYPSEFEEVSCITAMEAMHAGLPMLGSNVGALHETCDREGSLLLPLTEDGRADEDAFVGDIRSYIGNESNRRGRVEAQLAAAKSKTWVGAVDVLESVLTACLEKRRGTYSAALRHCFEHSDIGFMIEPQFGGLASDPIAVQANQEYAGLYSFKDSPAAYKAHYDKHGGAYYDGHESKVIGEDVTRTPRFQGVASLIAQCVDNAPGPVRVLDYGCAHGHYLMPLAKMFPESRFVGVDVSERAIGAAMKWALRDDVKNIELRLGSQEMFDEIGALCPLVYDESSMQMDATTGQVHAKVSHRDLFDVVIACEVVEHVPDWMDLLEKFRSVLKPDGILIVTTPYGRWEWQGTVAFREAREHLHHFERQDIVELCGRNQVQILYAPAGNDHVGKALGSWVWGVRPVEPFRMYDVERKRALLCPRETLSACLIVKDGEKTLRKCVESFIDWVDEVVIAVDPSTKDRTFDIIDNLREDFRWKPFTLVPGLVALEAGFDEARNRTIEAASGDWIMWVDADEEVQHPQNLWKYLRPSQHNAFGFPQVHYSADPANVLTTDFPCRLFRNRKGIKFYGCVHEHPEIEPGKAIPRSGVRHDVKFLHNGYVDENTRRQRYMRNLPLLHRDMEKHPTRGLNRFLWLRDIAQGLMFEHEQTQGVVMDGQRERAQEAINLWAQIVEKDPIRMAIDSLKYYSHCVQTLGAGFEADVSYNVGIQTAPDLACQMQFKGRFFNRDHYSKLMRKIEEEATRHYESKYL
jgi:glycosyltransferase involved in cell wall biosynthesis/2-polyprenyl-3-methyl-5-hydroxy-6-metoxy-1,4-benzoquinol methylase